jgi:SpoVK/Ycf46/Vps4 family AAA+-type ATPase
VQCSKLWLNRLLESDGGATIWITNAPDALGEATIRRMTFAVEFTVPPRRAREKIIAQQATRAGVALSSSEVAKLATLKASPAVLKHALTVAASTGGASATAMQVSTSLLQAMGKGPPALRGAEGKFDPRWCSATYDLNKLADRLAATRCRSWSILMGGPPGTGKTAYAHHLGERLGLEVTSCRGSDLLSPFVGGTEANIAGAFKSAEREGAILLIDEVDSFLFDRRGAERSWEAGMVNEMLRWMETRTFPLIATTNSTDRLDPASQRRFSLRIDFQALDEDRARALFEMYFGETPPPSLREVDGLTPGDFAVVAARAALLDEHQAEHLVDWLRREAVDRGDAPRAAGFHSLRAPDGSSGRRLLVN